MEFFASLFGFLSSVLLVGLAALVASLVFFAYAARQPPENPLRIIAGALASRIATTVGVAIIDMPITLFEPVGGLVDVASLGLLAYYWWTGLLQMQRAFSPPPPSSAPLPQPAGLYMAPAAPGRLITLQSDD